LKNYNEHIDDLIAKYLLSEATTAEIKQVEEWIALSEENQRYFKQMQTVLGKATNTNIQFNTDAAWEKVKSQIDGGEKATKVIPINRSNTFYYLRIAAVFVGVLLMSVIIYQVINNNIQTVTLAASDKTLNDTLTDGTIVFLNKNTSIVSNYNPNKKTHNIQLNGEAYFDIHKKDKEEFIIETQGILIKDIGTSFNVQSYSTDKIIEVSVEIGEVILYSETDPGITVYAGEKGTYDKELRKFTKTTLTDLNALAYKTFKFRFTNTSLGEIINALNKVYDRQIQVTDNIAQCKLTISFDNESIDAVAEVITETLGLSKTQSGNTIILEGNGCEK